MYSPTNIAAPPAERRKKIKDRLDEFDFDLKKTGNLAAQFQSGYYVHHTDVRWLLEQHERLLAYAEEARAWMLDGSDDLPGGKRRTGIRIRINIEGMTRK